MHRCHVVIVCPVTPPVATNVGMIVGATVGSLVGVGFLLLICVVYVLKRRRDNEDDLANEIK